MAFRDDVKALESRHAALSAAAEAAAVERDRAGALLEEARRLPVLDNLRVATPCRASWADMVGDDRSRHCGDCNKQVFNISGMTRADAEALLSGGNTPCVRYFQRADGTILLADCTVGKKRRRRRLAVVAAGAMAVASGAAYWKLRSSHAEEHEEVLGRMAPIEVKGEVLKL